MAAEQQRVVTFTLSDQEFEAIRHLVKSKTGISLGLHKRDLVISRLARRLRALSLETFSQYLQVLESPDGADELVQMINRITTNKTDFFREQHHFQYLNEKLLPELEKQGEQTGQRLVRVWSAGCSSGEEPYTLAMTMHEYFASRKGWRFQILATDLDTTMLKKASAGLYEARLLEPVPQGLLRKYFDSTKIDGELFYQVKPVLRDVITYRKFNLMNPTYPLKVELDFIFCRNVIIYFDTKDKTAIMTKFHRVLKPHGHIFVGHSESLMMVKDLFRNVGTTVYRKI